MPATNWNDQSINATDYHGGTSSASKVAGTPIGLLLALTQATTITVYYDKPFATNYNAQTINSTNWT